MLKKKQKKDKKIKKPNKFLEIFAKRQLKNKRISLKIWKICNII